MINLAMWLFALGTGIQAFSVKHLVYNCLPVISKQYWFMTGYFLMYLLSPVLLFLVKRLTPNQLKKLVLVLVFVFSFLPLDMAKIDSGYHFVWFCILFLVAACIRENDLFSRKSGVYFAGYFLLSALSLALKYVSDASHFQPINLTGYSSFLIFASSLLLFVAFKNLKLKERPALSKGITLLSSLTLGVYLISDNNFIRRWLWQDLFHVPQYAHSPMLIVYFVLAVTAIYVFCSFAEYMRQLLFKLFGAQKLTDKIGETLTYLFEWFLHSKFLEKICK